MTLLLMGAGGGGGGGGSFATWNPADLSGVTLSAANLKATYTGSPGGVRSTNALTGKHYAEFHIDLNATTDTMFGITEGTSTLSGFLYNAAGTHSVMIYNGSLYYNTGTTAHGLGGNSTGKVGQLCVDIPNKLIWVGFDNTFFGNPAAGTGGLNFPGLTGTPFFVSQGDGSDAITANFGQGFAFTPPAGFAA
jgi:hypothetical protein